MGWFIGRAVGLKNDQSPPESQGQKRKTREESTLRGF